MWMQYSASYWPIAEDIQTAVDRLSYQFTDLIIDGEHSLNYDTNICFDEETMQDVLVRIKKYRLGKLLCENYISGFYNLEEFCEEMIHKELKDFLHQLNPFLPASLLSKYDLIEDENENDDDEGGVDEI
jgi:hypothetical protein